MTATATRPKAPPAARVTPAITRSRWHEYRYAGVTYPGVTGILKVIDKSDALMGWASRQTAEAALSQLEHLASLRASVGPEGVIRALTSRSAWKRDEAAAAGNQIHAIADAIVRGETAPELAEEIRVRVDHYIEWWQASGWRIRLSEAYIVNPTLGYGGTLDLLAFDAEGRTVLADVKSGKSLYSEAILQLAAYGMPGNLIAPTTSPVTYPMPAVDRYVLLHVTDDGVREVEIDITDLEREAFLAAIPLSRWHKSVKDRRL